MKKAIGLICCSLLWIGTAMAQEAPVMLAVYEDHVMPSMDAAFRDGVKKLKAACEQNKLDIHWTTLSYDDNSFKHFVTIKSFADMDKDMFAALGAKIGKEALAAIWADLDKCISSRDSYVQMRMNNLSYLIPAPSGENYREAFYWYVLPGKEAEAEPLLMEWKKLNESKNTGCGYLVNKIIFGADQGYVISLWGKDAADIAAKLKKRDEVLGDELGKIWAKTLLITKKRYTKHAWVSVGLSNPAPAAATASK